VKLQLDRVVSRLAQQGFELDLNEDVVDYLSDRGYDPVYGARPLKRAIQTYLLDPLSLSLLEGKYAEGETIKVSCLQNSLSFS